MSNRESSVAAATGASSPGDAWGTAHLANNRALIAVLLLAMVLLVGSVSGTLAMVATAGLFAIPGGPLLAHSWCALRAGRIDAEGPLVLGAAAAFGRGLLQWATVLEAPVDFATPALVLTIALLGRACEEVLRRRQGAALRALIEQLPRSARVLATGRDAAMGKTVEIAAHKLSPGDRVLVAAGDAAPADGVVLSGATSWDESLLSGDPLPVWRDVGDEILGGARNTGDTEVTVEVRASGANTIVARRVARALALACEPRPGAAACPHGTLPGAGHQASAGESSDGPAEPMPAAPTDPTVATTATILTVLLAALGAWTFGGGFSAALSVLVIASPRAIALLRPAAFRVAVGRASQLGVALRDDSALTALGRIDTLLFDKTGTVTTGTPVLEELVTSGRCPGQRALAAAAAIEGLSSGPLSRALITAHERRGEPLPEVDAESLIAGPGGVRGALADGTEVVVGNPAWLAAQGLDLSPEQEEAAAGLRQRGWTLALVGLDGVVVALLAFGDQVRPTTTRAVRILRGLGITPILSTGDHQASALAMATLVGITAAHANEGPAETARRVNQLQLCGHRVGMLGDGVHDEQALQAADAAMVPGQPAELSDTTAPILLVRGDLARATVAIELARATRTIIRQGLGLALAYNILVITWAFSGGVSAPVAALLMSLATLGVLANGLRLERFRSRLETGFGLES